MAHHLRAEARSASWDELDHHQREAFKHIASMLNETLQDLQNTKSQPNASRGSSFKALRDKSSRIAFLSGARGTGKTTLLLSLEEATSNREAEGFQAEEIQKVLLPLQEGRLIWLEPLDMEPMPSQVNLLAAILSRIEAALQDKMDWFSVPADREGEYRPQGLFDLDVGSRNPLMQFRSLQNDIALAWEGNLKDRGGQIDPDPYAIEVIRTERSRLNVNAKFAEALEVLAVPMKAHRPQTQEPVFILPVDDLDLNPSACLELLRLLRMISVPRFFTLVLGDLDITSVVLNLKFSNNFAEVAGSLSNTYQDVIKDKATEVAQNALRKLIPPGQRVGLDVMRVWESLYFCPLQASEATGTVQKLYRLFQQVSLPVFTPVLLPKEQEQAKDQEQGQEKGQDEEQAKDEEQGQEKSQKQEQAKEQKQVKYSLLNLLIMPGQKVIGDPVTPAETEPEGAWIRPKVDPNYKVDEEAKELKGLADQTFYSGLHFLKATPRRIADIWYALQSAQNLASSPDSGSTIPYADVLALVAKHTRDALREDLPQTYLRTVEDAIAQNAFGDWELVQPGGNSIPVRH